MNQIFVIVYAYLILIKFMIYIYIDLLLFKIKVNFLVFSIFIDLNKFFKNDVSEGLLG